MEDRSICVTQRETNSTMAALPVALLRLTVPVRFLECTELRSWVLGVHGILAQTAVFSSSP